MAEWHTRAQFTAAVHGQHVSLLCRPLTAAVSIISSTWLIFLMSWGNHTGGGRMSCCEWRSPCTTLLHFTFNPAWWHRSAKALSIPTLFSCLHASSIPQVSPILPGERERLWSEDAAFLPQALSGKWGVRSQQLEVLPPAAPGAPEASVQPGGVNGLWAMG